MLTNYYVIIKLINTILLAIITRNPLLPPTRVCTGLYHSRTPDHPRHPHHHRLLPLRP